MSLITKVTGSEGSNPVFDGTMRGAIAFVVNSILALALTFTDSLEPDQVAILYALVAPLLFIAFGIWDRVR